MNRVETVLVALGLGMGVVFGMGGSMAAHSPILQSGLYEISSVGLVVSTTLLAIKFMGSKRDLLATGFLIFAIGEAIMTVGIPMSLVDGQPSFGAGMALYLPALCLISIPKYFPLWVRLAGMATVIPFAIAATKIFIGQEALSTSTFPGLGYGLLSLTIIGWILTFLKRYKEGTL